MVQAVKDATLTIASSRYPISLLTCPLGFGKAPVATTIAELESSQNKLVMTFTENSLAQQLQQEYQKPRVFAGETAQFSVHQNY